MSYGLEEYLTELKKEEATDPEEANQKYVELAIKRMVKTSDALKKVTETERSVMYIAIRTVSSMYKMGQFYFFGKLYYSISFTNSY